MIEFIIFLIIILPAAVFLTVSAVNAVWGPFLKDIESSGNKPYVSVLVPARNEEDNIKNCINSLLNQDYDNYEIIILDDESEDDTLKIIKDFAIKSENIRFIEGKPAPTGWRGKNWACFQLAQQAKADIIIFTDADNLHNEKAISKTVAYIQNWGLDFLSAFPELITVYLQEKLFVPIVDIILYSLLPLRATYFSKNPSLAAGNGQWIACSKDAYFNTGGHEAVKESLVEDNELSKLFKKEGYKILTVSGIEMIYSRMYSSFSGIINGFSKNFYGIAEKNPVILSAMILLFFSTAILPYFLIILNIFPVFMLIVILVNMAWRLVLSITFKHDLLASIVFHPVTIAVLIYIAVLSFYRHNKGSITWKGREIKTGNF